MGYQTTILQTTEPSFPWSPGDKLDAVPLNNQFIIMQNQINNLVQQVNQLVEATQESNLGVNITASFGGNSLITNGPYVLVGSAAYEFTIVSMDFSVGTNGGSYNAALLIDNVPVIGLDNVLVNQMVKQNVLAPANTVVHRGDELTVVISNVTGFPLNAWIDVNGTTNATPQPVIGITVGQAFGTSTAICIPTSVGPNQGFFVATGRATGAAVGLETIVAVGTTSGQAIVSATGVGVHLNTSFGTAVGTSSATATGGTAGAHVFVMDDPNFGILDVNPID